MTDNLKTTIDDLDLDVRLMNLKPTDVVVIKLKDRVTQEVGQRIFKIAQAVFPDNKVAILHPDIDIDTDGAA